MSDEQGKDGKSSKVLILGAGASAASKYGLPTMNGFFVGSDFAGDTKYPHLKEFLIGLCGTNEPGDEGLKSANLEEVLTYLDNLEYENLPVALTRKLTLQDVRSELNSYVLWRLVAEPLSKQNGPRTETALFKKFECDVHKRVFAHLNFVEDTILTLNYDLVADGTFAAMRSRQESANSDAEDLDGFLSRSWRILGDHLAIHDIGMPFVPQWERGIFLKLHGSVDYYHCPSPDCPNHSVIFANRGEHDGPPLELQRMLCRMCGRKPSLAIVPPTLTKTAGGVPRIGTFWSIAYDNLRDADRWVIWGVSLAESDHMLRALLREAAAEDNRISEKPPAVEVINTVFGPEKNPDESHDDFAGRRVEARRIAGIVEQLARGNVRYFADVQKWPDEEQKPWW